MERESWLEYVGRWRSSVAHENLSIVPMTILEERTSDLHLKLTGVKSTIASSPKPLI